MTNNTLRLDKKDFVFDTRGAVPRFVVESDEDNNAILINQFSCDYEKIGPRPYSIDSLKESYITLRKRGKQ